MSSVRAPTRSGMPDALDECVHRALWMIPTVFLGCGGGSSQNTPIDSPPPPLDDAAIDAVPPAPRELGIEVDSPAGDQTADIATVKTFGASVIPLTFPWSTLEPDGQGFDANAVAFLNFGMGYYHDHGMRVVLSIPVVDTVSTFVPSDLVGQKLDSAAVIARAQAFVTEVLAQSGPELEYLVLSNEVDINLADGNPTWTELAALTSAMATTAHTLRPDVKTGVSVTASAVLGNNVNALAALHASDVAFVTYYSAGNFGSTSGDVDADVVAIVAATDRPVVFKEFGYATGALLNGSEAGQADFVTHAFATWDAHADRVPLLIYSRMFDGDMTTCTAQAMSYGETGNQAFIQFLCSLGLRTYADQPKQAWATFVAAATARTWVH
jgi:hypothetical protein